VLWWVFSVLGCMVGSCRRGLAPWVILADGPGGLFVPGFARARCHGDGTPIRPVASGTKAAADLPPGESRHPAARLICAQTFPADSGSRESAYPACRALPAVRVNLDTLPGPAARTVGCPPRRRTRRAKLVQSSAVGRLSPAGSAERRGQWPPVRCAVSAGQPGLPPRAPARASQHLRRDCRSCGPR